MRIGIFGGSFNPIHTGHVALAKAMRERYRLDEVWLMVSPQNPLKQQADLLDDNLRLEMARLALQDVEGVTACDYEFHLPKPSYTWNTLKSLRQDFPDKTFVLLIGGDNWAHFERWYHWKDILRHHEVVVYPRGEVGGGFPLIDVSSTDIRHRIREGLPVEGLVPAVVAEYIKEHQLYAK
ncbi:MAG: nicotinate (nicotinamide) nucleotide adenylyltransferase [Prevotella sp.]|nr:nicotinate (nicotinamide) nucleotide adenylyltransferase [Prevotella sp.]